MRSYGEPRLRPRVPVTTRTGAPKLKHGQSDDQQRC
jgi:hypothetical protein